MSVSGFSTRHRFTAAKQLLSGSAPYHFSHCPSPSPRALNLWFLLIHLPAPDMGICRFCRMRLFSCLWFNTSSTSIPQRLHDCMTPTPPLPFISFTSAALHLLFPLCAPVLCPVPALWHMLLHLPFSPLVQSPGCVRLCAIPWTAAQQASLSLTISQSLPKFICPLNR